jgi:hypothetical protein
MSSPPFTFTDGDGTEVKVKLSGNGTLNPVADGDTFDLILTGTDQDTKLTITSKSGGDGRATIDDISSDGAIEKISAKKTDISGDVTLAGNAKTIKLGDFLAGNPHTMTIGGTSSAKRVSLTLRRVTGLNLTSGTALKEIDVTDWEIDGDADLVRAPIIKELDSKEDFHADVRLEDTAEEEAFLGSVDVDGTISGVWFVDGDANELEANEFATTFRFNAHGRLKEIDSNGDLGGTVTATRINKVIVKRDLVQAIILGGADMGDDGAFGGTGEDEDLFFRGDIGKVDINGQVIDSVLAAGLDPVNGTFGDGDDFVTGKKGSSLGKVSVTGTATNDSLFAAGDFKNIKIGGTKVDPAGDPRFLLASTDPDEDAPVIQAQLRNNTGDPNDNVTSDPTIIGRITDLGRIETFRVGIDDMELEDFESVHGLLEPNGTFELLRSRIENINEGPLTLGAHTINFVARDEIGNISAIFAVPIILVA